MNPNNKTLLVRAALALVAAAAVSACASGTGTDAPSTLRDESEYVTGSRIPQRDRSGVKAVSREELERMQSADRHTLPQPTRSVGTSR